MEIISITAEELYVCYTIFREIIAKLVQELYLLKHL
jgi:hypothetical protein